MGGGTYGLRKVRIFPGASLALSPEFVTNTLLGLSRPVGKGPGGLPRKSSTTPCGAALSLVGRRQINFTLISTLFHRKWGVASNISTASNGDFVQ